MSEITHTHKIKIEHFKNMVAVAFSDGYFDEVESDFLAHKAKEFGLPEEIIDSIIEEASKLPFIVPENQIDRENQLADIVYIAIIDGEIRIQEYKLCLNIAEKLGFDKSYVDEVINLTIKLWRHSQWYKRSVFRPTED
jgi:uncharacterized membrane protein YebE (DUF533 family)